MNARDRFSKTLNRIILAVLSIAVFGLLVNAVRTANATTPVAGNGRGGLLAARPTCIDQYRGRDWALYNADGTKSDVGQTCLLTSGSGLAWVTTGSPNH